jgi:hypothetical protein
MLWYAEMQNSWIVWGTDGTGGAGTEIDLHDDLDLDRHKYIPEYEARYQLRPSWAIRYSFYSHKVRAALNRGAYRRILFRLQQLR